VPASPFFGRMCRGGRHIPRGTKVRRAVRGRPRPNTFSGGSLLFGTCSCIDGVRVILFLYIIYLEKRKEGGDFAFVWMALGM
jgi:hypothetical protein